MTSPHRAKKRFGQNFLHDDGVIHRIYRAIRPGPDDHLVEIGPGQGALTQELVDSGNRLDVIELDRDLLPRLNERFANRPNFHLHQGDALKFDFASLQGDGELLRVVGNLPYNISTPLIFRLLAQQHLIDDMHFMLQKEVVERLAAEPGNKNYGRLSVMTQYYCRVESLFEVPPEAFDPRPKVQSAVVRLVPHKALPAPSKDIKTLENIVREAFNQRRKTLRNSLKNFIDEKGLRAMDIDPSARPETLSLFQFVAISNYVTDHPQEQPTTP